MPPKLSDEIRAALQATADPQRAPQMQAYMKSAMPSLGVRVPDVRSLTREVAQQRPIAARRGLERVVRDLWDDAEYRDELAHRVGELRARQHTDLDQLAARGSTPTSTSSQREALKHLG